MKRLKGHVASLAKVTLPGRRHPTPDFVIVALPHVAIAFSYEIPIGFTRNGLDWTVRVNEWSKTTGTHMNSLPSRKQRVPGPEFERLLQRAVMNDWEKLRTVAAEAFAELEERKEW